MSEPSPQWTPPEVCDQCPHPISEHTLRKPDNACDGWMHGRTPDCHCWHGWPRG